MRKLKLYDMIRSYDFGRRIPTEYMEGVIVGFDNGYIEFVITKRVCDGQECEIEENEIACTPPHGAIFIDAVNPRIEFIKSAPSCFTLDKDVRAALLEFRRARAEHQQSFH